MIPLIKETKATPPKNPDTIFLFSFLAAIIIAKAAAGIPPIIIGKKPDWKNPDPSIPLVKALMSPFTHSVVPDAAPVIGDIIWPLIGNWNAKL